MTWVITFLIQFRIQEEVDFHDQHPVRSIGRDGEQWESGGNRVSERENAMGKRAVNTIQLGVLVTLSTVLLLGLVGISVPNRVVESLGLDHTATARLQMGRFEKALELFLLDHGRYPTTAEGPQALVRNPGSMNWTGPYLSEPRIPADPWGRSYQ